VRIGIASFWRERPADTGAAIDRLVDFGRRIEELGFSGLWVGDGMGRGNPTMDPLLPLAALCSVTRRIELGTCVVQLPIRNPVELAHQAQTLNVLSQGRFSFGVGVGSTRADFDLLGADFMNRFSTLEASIDVVRRAWRGEPINGVSLSPWRANGSGPPILLGTWRNPGWISYAARKCEGWIASGLFSTWQDAEAGVQAYRNAGGKRAILTNVPVDFRSEPEYSDRFTKAATISLVCPIDVARQRLQRLEELGFDDVVLAPPNESPEYLDPVAELVAQHRS
jgi:alkanesulfonate monooxygenase SsuD/methylene tetrahydromethanopterin reductase-like flavin-dependent oxidoreductase (luciferase family)